MINSRAKNWFGGILLSLGIVILTAPILYSFMFPPVKVVHMAKPESGLSIMSERKLKPEKDWTDYGDKIVGWFSAISGSIVLLCNAKKKMEEK